MSIKNDINMVRDELNSEEKFFEKAVMTEKFVKKYKKPMIGALVAIVLLVGGNLVYDANKQSKIESANSALLKLQANSEDKNSLAELKSLSLNLHDAWILSQAIRNNNLENLKSLENSKAYLVNDLASYELAQASNDLDGLDAYASKEGALYKDLALVESAVILLKQNKIDEAHEKLFQIPTGSSLSKVASALLHYGVK
ncbi:MAG: hypothetical protein U9N02_08290 [Campylobacterota bacterium]|nr:hypothetical protein [Campylobacterota bacterium]